MLGPIFAFLNLPGPSSMAGRDICAMESCLWLGETHVALGATHVSGGDTCVSGGDTCVSGRDTCVWERHMCLGKIDEKWKKWKIGKIKKETGKSLNSQISQPNIS